MGVSRLTRSALVGAATIALSALPAAAQQVSYTTTGTFSGTGCTATSCNFGGFTLAFQPIGSTVNYLAPTFVDLGQFLTSCAACAPNTTASIPAGVTFTLTINQTSPAPGTDGFLGTITGALSFNLSSSTLFWTPSSTSLTIPPATYALVLDNINNGINITAPTTNETTNPTTVKAYVTATPEPSTVALMATGIIGLVPVIRRRRNNSNNS